MEIVESFIKQKIAKEAAFIGTLYNYNINRIYCLKCITYYATVV